MYRSRHVIIDKKNSGRVGYYWILICRGPLLLLTFFSGSQATLNMPSWLPSWNEVTRNIRKLHLELNTAYLTFLCVRNNVAFAWTCPSSMQIFTYTTTSWVLARYTQRIIAWFHPSFIVYSPYRKSLGFLIPRFLLLFAHLRSGRTDLELRGYSKQDRQHSRSIALC